MENKIELNESTIEKVTGGAVGNMVNLTASQTNTLLQGKCPFCDGEIEELRAGALCRCKSCGKSFSKLGGKWGYMSVKSTY